MASPDRPNATGQQREPLGRRLRNTALDIALVFSTALALLGGARFAQETFSSGSSHGTSIDASTATPTIQPSLTHEQVTKEFQLGSPIIAPDGHTAIYYGTDNKTGDRDLLVSTDGGQTFVKIGTHVVDAVWSPSEANGRSDLLAITYTNKQEPTTKTQYNEPAQHIALIQHLPDGQWKNVADTLTNVSDHFTYADPRLKGDWYDWSNNGYTITLYVPIEWSDPQTGKLVLGGKKDVSLTAPAQVNIITINPATVRHIAPHQ